MTKTITIIVLILSAIALLYGVIRDLKQLKKKQIKDHDQLIKDLLREEHDYF